MSTPNHFKIACPSCAGQIEFPKELHGQTIDCPHCGLSVALAVPGYVEPVPPPIPTTSAPIIIQQQQAKEPRKQHGVFYYVFWGVISLIVTMLLLGIGATFLGISISGFFQTMQNGRTVAPQTNSGSIAPPASRHDAHVRERWHNQAIQSKPEAEMLLASGRVLVLTNEIDDTVLIAAKDNQTGLRAGISIEKGGEISLALMAFDRTKLHDDRQPVAGFNRVRCRIGNDVFTLTQDWSLDRVSTDINGTRQYLFWPVVLRSRAGHELPNTIASNVFVRILLNTAPVKVEFSGSIGPSHTFTMSPQDVQAMREIYVIYASFTNASPVFLTK